MATGRKTTGKKGAQRPAKKSAQVKRKKLNCIRGGHSFKDECLLRKPYS